MKKYIILILLFYCIIGNCFRIYQNKIFGDMANLRIDSIKVEYFHSLLTKSDFTITIKKRHYSFSTPWHERNA